jgi:hypothetical protein
MHNECAMGETSIRAPFAQWIFLSAFDSIAQNYLRNECAMKNCSIAQTHAESDNVLALFGGQK